MRPFRWTSEGVAVRLDDQERRVVRLARDIVDGVGDGADDPASVRLAYDARPDDSVASERFRELTAEDLDTARRDDRDSFLRTIDAPVLTEQEAEAWMRVVGEARLVLAARLGIADDGWEGAVSEADPPEVLLLSYLGGIQDGLVQALMAGLG